MHDMLFRKSAGTAPEPDRPKRVGPIRRPERSQTGGEKADDERAGSALQRKPAVSQPSDAGETEADRVADQVMRMDDPSAVDVAQGPTIQRMGAHCDEEERKKKAGAPVTPDSSTSPTVHRDAERDAGPELDSGAAVAATRSGGQPLSAADRAFFEPRLDHDFSNVRVHTGSDAAAAAHGVRARAYAVGEHIVLGAGQPAPGTTEGRRLMAHELTHVVQQGAAGAPLRRKRDERAEIGTTTPGTVQRDTWTPQQEANFQVWWKRIAKLEGTLADWKANPANKYDKGGETNFGITWSSYQKVHPGATKEQFAAMTVEEAMRIAKGMYRTAQAHKIKDPGVATLVAESFWGSVSADALNAALKDVGRKGTATQAALSPETIDEINAADPQKLIDALVVEREKYHGELAKDPNQAKFLHGWNTRWDVRWIQAKLMTGHAAEAATWLNGREPKEIEEKLGWMSQEDQAALYRGAADPGGVGVDSAIAKATQHVYRVLKYNQAVAAGDWPTAAYFLNGFQKSDMTRHLAELKRTPGAIAALHAAAVSTVGAGSALAQETAPPPGK